LQPLYVNTKKRLVKSPRIYVRDSGITHALLGITDYNQLSGHPVYGSSWEAYVIENIVTLAKQGIKARFYRTAAGAEIDLILEFPNNKKWAIEIKSGLTPKITKGFYHALEDIKPDKSFVVYGGNDRYPLSEKTDVIGLYEILKLVVNE
jgi:predicted AAA+ superfamily ATPase